MPKRLSFGFFSTIFLISLLSCQQPKTDEGDGKATQGNSTKIKDQFVTANRLLLQKESDEMDAYERSHHLKFVKTNSGIRYYVYKPSAQGDSIRKGMQINLRYKVFLLNGNLCYSSEEDGVKQFLVEQEQIESGIHVGLQYLKKGDKALLLIPSHLAHGLLGDLKKIPPQMPIVYDVEVY
ncbi:MAG: FKBP-type peptidyl-prolyl cis-trans isomerase [Bacteroidia bacterium]|jgi:FKBP-type peptidyl-prolyl cis-trans isomerase|nr:FKBP-type peptidyl-prolyl cis-trans isomerase [Bacteroidia bacterium]